MWLLGSVLPPHGPEAGDLVVVVTNGVAAGDTVSADDVRLERRPPGQRPADALDRVAAGVGRVAAGALSPGEILTGARFQGPGQLTGMPPGRVAVSVPLLESGLLSAIRPADVVQVLANGTGQTVAANATVLTVARPDDGVLGQGPDAGGHVVLALTAEEARAVAVALPGQSGPAGFILALHGP